MSIILQNDTSLDTNTKYTKFPFNFFIKCFSSYPTGRLITKLDNKISLEVMLIAGVCHEHEYYILTTEVPNNVYNECNLVPFIQLDWPSSIEWEFITNTGRILEFNKKTEYIEVL